MSLVLTNFERAALDDSPSYLIRLDDTSPKSLVASASSLLAPISPGIGNELVPSEGIFCPKSLRFHGVSSNDYIRIGRSDAVKPANKITILFVIGNLRNPSGQASSICSCVTSRGYSINLDSNGQVTFNINDGSKFISCSFDRNKLKASGSLFHAIYDGRYASIYVDGVLSAQYDNGSVKSIAYDSSDLFIATGASMTGLKLDFDCFLFGVYSVDLSPAQVAAQYSEFSASMKISGTSILDSGVAADKVNILSLGDGRRADVIPAVTGAFSALVPPGEYILTAIGPSGYRPISHGPVTAVTP